MSGGPGGGQVSPAPAQPNTSGQLVNLVLGIVQNTRAIAQQVPAAGPIVRQINDLVQQLQRTIVANQPPSEPAAPPV